jgi:hypothetical protein
MVEVDITRLISFHREQKTIATVTAIQPDTLRDRIHLEDLRRSGKAPWRVWQ